MSRKSPVLLLIIVACTAQAAEHFDGNTWWDTVKEISDDKYEGRDTGSKGEHQAQEFIVGKLKALGVEPAGADGYFQSVNRNKRSMALDLKTDSQEKNRHQAVVDPMLERFRKTDRSDPDLAGGLQQRGVIGIERRIGDHQGRKRPYP